jgi:hypothetical protein
MKDHRVRLTDSDLEILCASLRARVAMTRGARRVAIARLLERLEECEVGNPNLRFRGELEPDTPRQERPAVA